MVGKAPQTQTAYKNTSVSILRSLWDVVCGSKTSPQKESTLPFSIAYAEDSISHKTHTLRVSISLSMYHSPFLSFCCVHRTEISTRAKERKRKTHFSLAAVCASLASPSLRAGSFYLFRRTDRANNLHARRFEKRQRDESYIFMYEVLTTEWYSFARCERANATAPSPDDYIEAPLPLLTKGNQIRGSEILVTVAV